MLTDWFTDWFTGLLTDRLAPDWLSQRAVFYVNGDWEQVWIRLQFLSRSIDVCSQWVLVQVTESSITRWLRDTETQRERGRGRGAFMLQILAVMNVHSVNILVFTGTSLFLIVSTLVCHLHSKKMWTFGDTNCPELSLLTWSVIEGPIKSFNMNDTFITF